MPDYRAFWQRTERLLTKAKTLLLPEVAAANETDLLQFDEFLNANELGLAFEWLESITYEDQPTCLPLLHLLRSAVEEMSKSENVGELNNRISALENLVRCNVRTSALGRLLPVVTVRDFSWMATCYPELNGQVRPRADLYGETRLNEISFEKIDTSAIRKVDFRYSAGVVMLWAGVLLFLVTFGTVFSAIGVGLVGTGYASLLLFAPKLHYFRYLWLDQDGIHHVEGGGMNDRTSHFSWHEIESVETSHDEFKGLILTLNRMGMRGVPILLSAADADEAAGVIRECIEAHRLL